MHTHTRTGPPNRCSRRLTDAMCSLGDGRINRRCENKLRQWDQQQKKKNESNSQLTTHGNRMQLAFLPLLLICSSSVYFAQLFCIADLSRYSHTHTPVRHVCQPYEGYSIRRMSFDMHYRVYTVYTKRECALHPHVRCARIHLAAQYWTHRLYRLPVSLSVRNNCEIKISHMVAARTDGDRVRERERKKATTICIGDERSRSKKSGLVFPFNSIHSVMQQWVGVRARKKI